jgi:hypothetical protein
VVYAPVVGDLEERVGVAGLIEWAPAGQVLAAQRRQV